MGALTDDGADRIADDAHGQRDVGVRGSGPDLDFTVIAFPEPGSVLPGEGLQGCHVHGAHAGSDPQQLALHIIAFGLPALQDPVQVTLHGLQAAVIVRAVFIENRAALGNGIDCGAAFDRPDIVGCIALGRRHDGIQFTNDAGHDLNGIVPAEVTVGVTALGLYRNPVPVRADRGVRHAADVAVKGIEALNLIAMILENLLGAVQISQSLFTGIGYDHEIMLQFIPMLQHIAQTEHQGHQVGGVIPDARRGQDTAGAHHGQRLRIREDDVHVGHEDRERFPRHGFQPADDILRFINVGIGKAVGPEPVQAVFCPQVFLVAGSRDLPEFLQHGDGFSLVLFNKFKYFLFHFSVSFRTVPGVWPWRLPW